MTRRDLAILVACALASIAAYVMVGSPFVADQPISQRQAELMAKNPADMTPAETLARLEQLTVDRPDDPQPHAFIGDLLRSSGRDSDAARAYQSALRRDDRYVPALIGLADTYVRMESGTVSQDAQRLYARANEIDPEQIRAGFLGGLHAWQTGDEAGAEAVWGGIRAGLAQDDPRVVMLDAWIETARSAE